MRKGDSALFSLPSPSYAQKLMFFTKFFSDSFSRLLNVHLPTLRKRNFLQKKFLKNFCKSGGFPGVGIRKQKFFVKTADFWALVSGGRWKTSASGILFFNQKEMRDVRN